RRHTRFSRDWSSDVCSSDVVAGVGIVPARVDEAGETLPHQFVMADVRRIQGRQFPGRRLESAVVRGPGRLAAARAGAAGVVQPGDGEVAPGDDAGEPAVLVHEADGLDPAV